MSSIEKALERLMAKNGNEQSGQNGFASVRDLPDEDLDSSDDSDAGDEAASSASTAGTGARENVARKRNNKILHLDYQKLALSGYLTPDNINHKLSEEYRIIKRPLLVNAYGKGAEVVKNGNMVMITSALPGEGKTYTTLNLAFSIAMELDSTVLLVDGDIITASLSAQLGVENQPGLMELLDPNQDFELPDVLISTDLPRMKILPAGRLVKNPTELLSSVKMQALVDELATRYSNRIVLFDAPPLLATTEASSLMDHMGQILFVVEAGKTSNESITSAIEKIDQEKVIGIVLNKSRYAGKGEYYGGYYGARQAEKQVLNEE